MELVAPSTLRGSDTMTAIDAKARSEPISICINIYAVTLIAHTYVLQIDCRIHLF